MHKGKYVFSQLLDFLERNDFNYLARKYGGDKYVKHFTRYNQLYVLTFGQLSNRDYRIFEEFAYKVIAEAQRCRIVISSSLTEISMPLSWLCSERRKEASRCIHCIIWKHRFPHSFT